jgi:serine/threonine protein kinase
MVKLIQELKLDGEKYPVESELGEGGYGKVYKCRDPAGNVVAVKIIKVSSFFTFILKFLRLVYFSNITIKFFLIISWRHSLK